MYLLLRKMRILRNYKEIILLMVTIYGKLHGRNKETKYFEIT